MIVKTSDTETGVWKASAVPTFVYTVYEGEHEGFMKTLALGSFRKGKK